MDSKDIEKIKNLGKRMRQINSKFRLLNLLRLAKEEYDKSQYEDCIKTCEEALKINPNDSASLRGLGCSMQAMGNFEKAKYYYEKALEFSKHKEIEYTLLGTLCYLEEDLEEALRYYNCAIDANEGYDPAYEGKNQTMLEKHLQILDLQDMLIKQEFKQ